ncbi:MAG: transglutaminase family protein [Phycisphaerales bacterium]|nr:transglutaminase family protein [Phycisphaerales bacterium]
MRYEVTHTTRYVYAEPVTVCQNLAHLLPRVCPRQMWLSHELAIHPEPASVLRRIDYFGNPMTLFSIQEPHRSLTVVSHGKVEVDAIERLDSGGGPAWEQVRDQLAADKSRELVPLEFTLDSPLVRRTPELAEFAGLFFMAGRPIVEAVKATAEYIFREFTFDNTTTTISTPLEQVLRQRRGVCQDFSHLMIGAMRSVGLSARYVSGYLMTQPPPGQSRLQGADASHAWVGFYVQSLGWVDVDPTNNMWVSDQHIAIAWGRDFGDVSPLQGVILGGQQQGVSVAVDVVPMTSDAPASAT